MPTVYPQRQGNDGILDTLRHMQRLVNQRFLHPLIRKQAAGIIGHCRASDKRCQAASLLTWVQRKMQFIRDPVGVEALHDPLAIAVEIEKGLRPFGDCDDFSMYLATLMKSVGLPAIFRVAGYNGRHLSHVFVVGPHNMELDATRDLWNPQIGELLPMTSTLDWNV